MNNRPIPTEIKAEITAIGKVEDNIQEAKEYALELKKYYSSLIFSEEQINEAKEERANINKMIKKISDYRKSIIEEFKKPISNFEMNAKECEKILKETAEYVDNQVKSFEDKEKEIRFNNAKEIYNNLIEELKEVVPFEKVFNDKWLNKGSWKGNKSTLIEDEINSIKETIRGGFKVIEGLNSEFELELKSLYLVNYSLEEVLNKKSELEKNKELFINTQNAKKEIEKEKIEEMLTNEVKEDETDPIMTYTLKITGPLSKQKALKQFLELNEMKYERL